MGDRRHIDPTMWTKSREWRDLERIMTPQDIKNYRHIDRMIRIEEKKLDRLRENSTIADKVFGSSADYPYDQRSYKISTSVNQKEIADSVAEIRRLHELKRTIEEIASFLTDPVDKIIFDKTMQGQSQTQIAIGLGINHATVNKRLARILKAVN